MSEKDSENTEVLLQNDSEVELLNERLKELVIDPINEKYSNGIQLKSRICKGEDIARAIPDIQAFLAEVDLQKKDGILLDFLEVNSEGQLVMKDDCAEAYGLGENALQACMRQTRIVFKDAEGRTQTMTGKDFFTVTKVNENGVPLEMRVSMEAQAIAVESILMTRGLATLKWTSKGHIGEYARMNRGQLEHNTYTWTEDDSLGDPSLARYACSCSNYGHISSYINNLDVNGDVLGSRGVVKVNLNFKS